MRMACRPRQLRSDTLSRANHPPHLHPPVNDVKLRRPADEAEPASDALGLSEASVEKEEQRLRLVAGQVTLRGTGLTEDWTPSRGARERVAPQIRIEMRTVVAPDSATRQVLDDLRNRRAVERANFAVRRRRSGVGNRQRAQLTVEDWTRASAVRRIEAFAAEDELHRSRIAPSCYISRRTRDRESYDARFRSTRRAGALHRTHHGDRTHWARVQARRLRLRTLRGIAQRGCTNAFGHRRRERRRCGDASTPMA